MLKRNGILIIIFILVLALLPWILLIVTKLISYPKVNGDPYSTTITGISSTYVGEAGRCVGLKTSKVFNKVFSSGGLNENGEYVGNPTVELGIYDDLYGHYKGIAQIEPYKKTIGNAETVYCIGTNIIFYDPGPL